MRSETSLDRITSNERYVTGSSGVTTSHFKIEAEAPFNQVRIWLGNKYASGTLGNFKALIGVTDTGAVDTVDNTYTPQQSGVPNNALVASGIGWYATTWAGGATSINLSNVAVAGNTALHAVSDWINLSSIPRSDVVGGRPMLVMRVAQTGASGQYTQETASMAAYSAGRGLGLSWWREYLAQKVNSDGVNTISNKPPLNSSGGFQLYAFVEFRYSVVARSVVTVGDSRMASAFSTYLYDNWPAVALRGLSTQSKPIGTCNVANSGASAVESLALLDAVIAQGSNITDVILQGWSQNGFTQTDAGANTQIALILSYIVKLQAMNIKVFVTTDYGLNGYTGVAEAARVKCVNQVKTWASQGLVKLIDTDSIITDYSGGSGIINAAYNSGDSVHANPAGQALMSALLASVWS